MFLITLVHGAEKNNRQHKLFLTAAGNGKTIGVITINRRPAIMNECKQVRSFERYKILIFKNAVAMICNKTNHSHNYK